MTWADNPASDDRHNQDPSSPTTNPNHPSNSDANHKQSDDTWTTKLLALQNKQVHLESSLQSLTENDKLFRSEIKDHINAHEADIQKQLDTQLKNQTEKMNSILDVILTQHGQLEYFQKALSSLQQKLNALQGHSHGRPSEGSETPSP